ncbi:hypothetical protein [Vibrio cholerae]|uniref:hypothetical protein n=1 Tax=Vibrio cholerae TaxID=666 RepID=UPI001E3AA9D6|nr:hypothetical protein [Vibrio cholerae]HDI3289797.1 hypothetical protein [Vibrio cholerae]
MATTIQVSENISVSKYIEINGQRCEVEAVSFSPAITEASAKDAIFQAMEQEMLERKIIQKNEDGQYVLCDSGDLLIPEEDWEDEDESVMGSPGSELHCPDCYQFGVDCREKGMDFAQFLAAFNRSYKPNQHAIDSAKAGFYSN